MRPSAGCSAPVHELADCASLDHGRRIGLLKHCLHAANSLAWFNLQPCISADAISNGSPFASLASGQ